MATYFELTSFGASKGFTISGLGSNEYYGISVSGAGDVNGDGFDDVIIGVAKGGVDPADRSYVVFGAAGPGVSLNVNNLNGANGFAIGGIDQAELSGHSVASAGDINGDGIDGFFDGGGGIDRFASRAGSDTMIGTNDVDIFFWRPRRFHGLRSSDVLNGGASNDIIFGNAGNYTIIFELGGGTDTLRDFTS